MFAQRWPACAAGWREHGTEKATPAFPEGAGRASVSATPLNARHIHRPRSGLVGLTDTEVEAEESRAAVPRRGPGCGTAQGSSSSALGQVGEGWGQIPPQNIAQRRLAVSGWLCNPWWWWWWCDALPFQSRKRPEMVMLSAPRKIPGAVGASHALTSFSKALQQCSR